MGNGDRIKCGVDDCIMHHPAPMATRELSRLLTVTTWWHGDRTDRVHLTGNCTHSLPKQTFTTASIAASLVEMDVHREICLSAELNSRDIGALSNGSSSLLEVMERIDNDVSLEL